MSKSVNIGTLRRDAETARKYKWDLKFNLPQSGQSFDSRYNLRCLTVSQPKFSINTVEIDMKGFTKVEPGAITWDPITVTFVETEDFQIASFIWSWAISQFHPQLGIQGLKKGGVEGTEGLPNGVVIQLLAVDDSLGGKWDIYGCVFESVDWPDLDGSKDGIWDDLSMTIRYDYALWSAPGASTGSGVPIP